MPFGYFFMRAKGFLTEIHIEDVGVYQAGSVTCKVDKIKFLKVMTCFNHVIFIKIIFVFSFLILYLIFIEPFILDPLSLCTNFGKSII